VLSATHAAPIITATTTTGLLLLLLRLLTALIMMMRWNKTDDRTAAPLFNSVTSPAKPRPLSAAAANAYPAVVASCHFQTSEVTCELFVRQSTRCRFRLTQPGLKPLKADVATWCVVFPTDLLRFN